MGLLPNEQSDMDKSWMILIGERLSPRYRAGVDAFIEFAKANAGGSSTIRCPCNKCMNLDLREFHIVQDHLVLYGIMVSYKIWLHHGEHPDNQPDDSDDDSDGSDDDDRDEYPELLEDHCRGTYMDDDAVEMDHDVRNFEKILEASQREMYPGCKNFTLLAFVVKMLHVKVESRWSNKSFDRVLQIFRDLLPEGHLVPGSIYEAKKLLRDLGLGYETIDACQYDCALFWKENSHLEKCPVCGESRYKLISGKGKKIPRKVLRYFPLTPRLRRLYMSRKTATEMRWHRDKRVDDGIMRHPADSEEWKEFDLQHPEFAQETRNVRLGLATDGFNPFGNMSNAYSMWPVILMPYNLPPWMCMKESFFMLSLLIPGPQAPGNDIDVYLRPLVDELKELWDNGVVTYDASIKQTFRMHAAILWTINDFPAYANLSGWSTKGYMACPPCNDDPLSHRLRSKIGYTGHRAYLPGNHSLRRSKDFNGKSERRRKSLELPVEKVLDQLDQLPKVNFGKHPTNKKKTCESEALNWKKKSILFELPYWKERKLRYNLDVMHIEKNICEAIIGTMLGIDGKNKDTNKSRLDLEDMGIRSKLHLERQPNGSIHKPMAAYTLSPKEREGFCAFLASIKYPDGYAANLSRCVTIRGGKLSGLKSHDCHVLLQRLLPIGMHGFVNKKICTTLFELGSFFQDLCSKTLRRGDLEKLEERIVLILCKLERIFPPAFFDVMVHLTVHLPREAILAGPVQFRWMYPIERFLGTLKWYVTNRARPEGSIAEAYIAKECLTFCAMYLKGVDREERNVDCGEPGPGLSLSGFTQSVRPFGPITRAPDVSQKDLDMAHWFVLYNSPELEPYLEEHKSMIQNLGGRDITQIQREEFSKWFRQRMNQLRTQGSPRATNELWSLANGPDIIVHLYEGCICNGVRFHTKDRDNRRKSQNSGLVVEGDHDGQTIDFYGYLCKVWELKYFHGKVVLFQCEWFNTGGKNRIHKGSHVTSIDVRGRWYESDPFVFPEHVKQVFYVDDTKLGAHWKVVEQVKQRGVWDVPEQDDHDDTPNDAFQQEETTDVVPILLESSTNDPYYRDDIDPNVIPGAELNTDHGDDEDETMTENVDDEEENLHSQSDPDIDLDMDYDV